YTVTQSVGVGCTSAAGSGVASPGNPPNAPTVTVTDNCTGTSTLTASNFTGALLWSTGETTPSITVTTAGTYTVTQSVGVGCTSAAGSGVARPSNPPNATTVTVNE